MSHDEFIAAARSTLVFAAVAATVENRNSEHNAADAQQKSAQKSETRKTEDPKPRSETDSDDSGTTLPWGHPLLDSTE